MAGGYHAGMKRRRNPTPLLPGMDEEAPCGAEPLRSAPAAEAEAACSSGSFLADACSSGGSSAGASSAEASSAGQSSLASPSAAASSQGVSSAGRAAPQSSGTAAPQPEQTDPLPAGEMPELRGRRVYVVDAHALLFQVFHAIPEMTSPAGEPVNAVFGFSRDMMFLIEEHQPDYLFCAFDSPGPTFRHELYDDYKVQREEMPDDLQPQIEWAMRVLRGLSIPVLSVEGFEADDILATVARLATQAGASCILVTNDKDCRQLLSDRVALLNVRKNELYDVAALRRDWGIEPQQVVDFQALVGDPVDNIPGVPLIGPKIAGQLLQQHGTLEAILDWAAALPEKHRKKREQHLVQYREQALLSRELVRLDPYVPLEIDWDAGRVAGFDMSGAVGLFSELGFRSLTEKVRRRHEAGRPAEAWQADYRTVTTPEQLDQLVAELRRQQRFAFDTETTSTWPTWAEIVGYSFCFEPGRAFYIPVRAPGGEPQLDPELALHKLRSVLEDPSIEKVGQNLKYDMLVVRGAGAHLAGPKFDTMLASYLLDAGQRTHNLDDLARRYLHHTKVRIEELIGSGKQQKRMDEVPLAQISYYAAEDADVPLRLRPLLDERLQQAQLAELYYQVELPLMEVLVEMEATGIRVDRQRLAELSRMYAERMAELEREIYALAGRPFNIASPKQLQQVLFEEQQLPSQKRIKTGQSTDAEVLEQLAVLHPLPAKILQYRQYAKLKGTYVDALPAMIHPRTGRVHASFNQSVAATGRLSSSDPNLQNIPVRSEAGREIRSAFLPAADDWLLLAADYSQIELRVLAHFSGDEALCQAFARDEDIHARVAAQVHGVPLEEVTAEMRRRAKAVNFGIIYGQSPFGLARQLGITHEEAAAFIDAYFARYGRVEEFIARTLAECRQRGYVTTILGRRRAIRGVGEGAGRQRNLSERTAVNTVIQGSAADLIKLAMIHVHQWMRQHCPTARLLLQIHDELIFECPADQLDTLLGGVRQCMAGVLPLHVPLKVDLAAGPNWAQLQPI
jgi:DNA polymerase-1